MPQRYQTPVGETVELSRRLLGTYIYCTGCTRGWNETRDRGEQAASGHAETCRRKPGPGKYRPDVGAIGARR